MPTPYDEAEFIPAAFEQISVTSSATALGSLCSSGIPTGARHADFYPETTAVRFRADGSSPTASAGVILPASTMTTFTNRPQMLNAMKLIRTGSSDITVNVHFYK